MPTIRDQKSLTIRDFKGFSEGLVPGANPQLSPDAANVKFKWGRVFSRGGMTEFQAVTTAASPTPIIGLFNFKKPSGTHELLRMLTSAVEKFSGGVWSDITPVTALTGTSTTRPQYDTISDGDGVMNLVFTNEGEDTPKRYTGTGDFSDIGGTPPYAKVIHNYLKILFLGNISDSGAFTDVVDGHFTGRFSEDWTATWDPCDNNTIVLDETPGAWIASETYMRSMWCAKTDGIVKVTFTGSELRFNQELITGDVGVVAPLSFKRVGQKGIMFLGTDGLIYLLTATSVTPISYGFITDLLTSRLSSNKLQFARAVVDSEDDTYYLIYDRTGLSGQANDSYIAYNYLSGEWSHGFIGQSVYACEVFKATEYVSEDVLLAESALVDTFDDLAATDDNSTAVSRYWTTGWQRIGEEGWLNGVKVNCKRATDTRIKVDVALNLEENGWIDSQTFALRGGSPNDENVEVTWRTPPKLAEWYNVRVRMVHNAASAQAIVNSVTPIVTPILPVGERIDRGASESGGVA